jgi:hypothetical protein
MIDDEKEKDELTQLSLPYVYLPSKSFRQQYQKRVHKVVTFTATTAQSSRLFVHGHFQSSEWKSLEEASVHQKAGE